MRTEFIDYLDVEFEVEYYTTSGEEETGIPACYEVTNVYINNVCVTDVLNEKVLERLEDELTKRIC